MAGQHTRSPDEIIEETLAQHEVVVFSRVGNRNPFTIEALAALTESGYTPFIFDLTGDDDVRERLNETCGDELDPKIFVKGRFLGGARMGGGGGILHLLANGKFDLEQAGDPGSEKCAEHKIQFVQGGLVCGTEAPEEGAGSAQEGAGAGAEEGAGSAHQKAGVAVSCTATQPTRSPGEVIEETLKSNGVVIFSRPGNPFTLEALAALKKYSLSALFFDLTDRDDIRIKLTEICGDALEPKIFVKGRFIGGAKLGGDGGIIPHLAKGTVHKWLEGEYAGGDIWKDH
mmetsp:Transcript_122784/g.342109  ORF Transcript_122784/g.342109 Transcript_122784/m.342109 type:complete len:286 (-) Transcript_122784:257-1114(-)